MTLLGAIEYLIAYAIGVVIGVHLGIGIASYFMEWKRTDRNIIKHIFKFWIRTYRDEM